MDQSYPIVFYVSGHGFGHASRTIEVIGALAERRPGVPVIVKTSAPHRLFDRALRDRIELFNLQCDTGIVQIDSLNLDAAESILQARAFHGRLPEKAQEEAAFLRRSHACLVVGDVPPLAFAAAHEAGIPSVLIGNFTWDWIYAGYPEQRPADLIDVINGAYRKATRALRLPASGGFEGLESITTDIPFIARHSKRDATETRRGLGLPDDKPLVLMSFGGYGLDGLDTAALAQLKEYAIATSDLREDRLTSQVGLMFVADQDLRAQGFRYEDLVRAADVVVTKPGYGIVTEAMANDTAMLYTSRGQFVEYDVLVKEMARYLRCRFIERDDLLSGNWGPALEQLLASPPPLEKPELNGAEVAAREIIELLE
jgi:hypothetical protein